MKTIRVVAAIIKAVLPADVTLIQKIKESI
jgi:hypothetical protein